MKTREPGKFSYLLIGIGLAAIGGLISALLGTQGDAHFTSRARQKKS